MRSLGLDGCVADRLRRGGVLVAIAHDGRLFADRETPLCEVVLSEALLPVNQPQATGRSRGRPA